MEELRMKEIGGYLELDRYHGKLLHEEMLALNCGRNALVYLIRARGIKRIWLPRFLCGCVPEACRQEGCEVLPYAIGEDFMPRGASPAETDWMYIVNYYGQLSNAQLQQMTAQYARVIVDQAQGYFQPPLPGVDTLYTCRKFFGVADGAFLSTDAVLDESLERDESHARMGFVLGRYERPASEFYSESAQNNHQFDQAPVRKMSALTENLLRALDYDAIRQCRTRNFRILHEAFAAINGLKLTVPDGAFMYPLYMENGREIRKALQAKKIYIPTLWPDVFEICGESDLEYRWAKDILPLPVDQRYDENDMQRLIDEVFACARLR